MNVALGNVWGIIVCGRWRKTAEDSMIMDIPRVGHGQIPSLQKLPMAEMPLEAYKGGAIIVYFTL